MVSSTSLILLGLGLAAVAAVGYIAITYGGKEDPFGEYLRYGWGLDKPSALTLGNKTKANNTTTSNPFQSRAAFSYNPALEESQTEPWFSRRSLR